MKKIITEEQIKAILGAFFQVNAGVQIYTELQKLFEGLPKVEEQETK